MSTGASLRVLPPQGLYSSPFTMATFALTQSRTLFSTARFSAAWPRVSAAFLPALAVSPPFQWSIPSLQSLLELIPPFLLAVPKKKVSHSRKAMRSANKGLKDKQSTLTPSGRLIEM